MPAREAAYEHIQDDGQIDELTTQAHVGDVRTPHLVRPYNNDVLHQVRIMTVAVIALRGAYPLCDRRQQVVLAHHA